MKKVLVIDDSKTIRTLCEWIYKGLEDRLLTADSASSARQVIQDESPDVIIVDYTLPDEDAYEFVSSIRSSGQVIMMGGTYAPFDATKALASGAVATLMKPFKTAIFFETVEAAMLMSASPSEGVHEPSVQSVSPSAFGSSSSVSSVVPPVPSSSVNPVVPPVPSSSVNPVVPFGAKSSSGVSVSNSVPPVGVSAAGSQPIIPPVSSVTSGIHPVGAKRFNFPGSNAGISPVVPSASSVSESPVSPLIRTQGETPKTPVPSISPAFQAGGSESGVQIDPAVLRAEVIAAVKSMLPAIVNSYLKKLIQAEVKPQLQNWVDARVEALIKKIMQS